MGTIINSFAIDTNKHATLYNGDGSYCGYMHENLTDLHDCSIINADGADLHIRHENNHISKDGVSVYFRNLEKELINKINDADIVFGCVAWLTNFSVLEALRRKSGVQIIVQKEDFLRPDGSGWNKMSLHRAYQALPETSRYYVGMGYNVCCGDNMGAVRCAGMHNDNRNPAFPRMHNKFLVMCRRGVITHATDPYVFERYERDIQEAKLRGGPGKYPWELSERQLLDNPPSSTFDENICIPYGVWTGSFNVTWNATNSLENAVFIENYEIANAYFKEYSLILGISEPLDWESKWVMPEYRIGT